tara:strand:- start:1068 stop:1382 length:315 start_codon:yes stop_codon:yes gene_type:complete
MGQRNDVRRNGLRDIELYLEEAIKNIREDRAMTHSLLADVMGFIKNNEQNHRDVGLIAAKYVETLQRSNEQLVKITNLLHRKSSSPSGLSERDKDEIFDILNED